MQDEAALLEEDRQQNREEDALWLELGKRAFEELVYGEGMWLAMVAGDALKNDEQRPCGCGWDYHMSDCPILTDRGGSDDYGPTYDSSDPDTW